MSTLLLLDPAFGTLDPKKMLAGQLAVGRKVVRVWTDHNNLSNGLAFPLSGAHGAMIAINNALLRYPGTASDPTIVMAWSRGSEMFDKWMRELGPASIINPNTFKAYLLGDPENKFGGACKLRPTIDKPIYPGNTAHGFGCPTPAAFHGGMGVGYGPPNTCPWDVTYVIQEWDGWADAPINATIAEIAAYFTPGDVFCKSRLGNGPHADYSKSLTDPTNPPIYVDPVQPTIKYQFLRTGPMPGMGAAQTPNWIANEYAREYPIVLPGYSNRPVVLPILS